LANTVNQLGVEHDVSANVANAAYTSSNQASIIANAAFVHANSGYAFANSVYSNYAYPAYVSIAAGYAVANAAFNKANGAFTVTNSAFVVINSAFGSVNTVGGYANTSGLYANQAGVIANAAFNKANLANALAYNTGIGANAYTSLVYNIANAAFDRANNSNDVLFIGSAYNTANAGYDKANNALANTSGSVFNGNLIVSANVKVGFNLFFSANGHIYNRANSSGDGYGYDTLEIYPDNRYSNGLIIDPTAPNHIHLRGTGDQDNAIGDLFLGGENSYFQIPAGVNPPPIISSNGSSWIFRGDDGLQFPDSSNQYTAYTNTVFNVANAAFDAANNIVVPNVSSLYDTTNALFTVANNISITLTDIAPAYNTANAAYNTANHIFGVVNTALQNTSGTFAGNLTITGNTTVNKQVFVNYTPASPSNAAIEISAANTNGGTGYADILKLTNISGGATNPAKWIRITAAGALEFVNSAYNMVSASLTDTGNLTTAGSITPGAWTAGQVIKDTMLSNSDVTVSTTTVATSTSDTDFITYSYTPVSTSSYLIIHVHVASYDADSSAGTGIDSYISRIKVDGAEITWSKQYTKDTYNFRTGVLFPLTGRYTNSSTAAKTITVAVRRDTADDNITITNSATSLWMRITEVAR
jgi:hypothetical protein